MTAARSTDALSILVVDDNRDAADTLAMLFRLAGHDVRVAYDGPTALDHLRDWEPDVAVLDLVLPKLDGYTLAARLRQACRRRPLLVAVSGLAATDDAARAYAAGFDFHFRKPADPAVVLDVVRGFALRHRTPAPAGVPRLRPALARGPQPPRRPAPPARDVDVLRFRVQAFRAARRSG